MGARGRARAATCPTDRLFDSYNISHPDMHAFFVAHGPFATRLIARQKAKRGSEQTEVIAGFANTEIYNLVTSKLLRLRHTAPNNGTVGFWDQYID